MPTNFHKKKLLKKNLLTNFFAKNFFYQKKNSKRKFRNFFFCKNNFHCKNFSQYKIFCKKKISEDKFSPKKISLKLKFLPKFLFVWHIGFCRCGLLDYAVNFADCFGRLVFMDFAQKNYYISPQSTPKSPLSFLYSTKR